MKRIIIMILSLISLIAEAQESRTIAGNLLNDGNGVEELDPAILDEGRVLYKDLTDKGMKISGGVIYASSESIGKELGSIVRVKEPFLVHSIGFTVMENQSEGCRVSIRIYRIQTDDSLEDIVTIPICQNIPVTSSKTRLEVAPAESLLLEPGEYYIGFRIDEVAEGRIYFPLYMKKSYFRNANEEPLQKCRTNIGISVRGSVIRD